MRRVVLGLSTGIAVVLGVQLLVATPANAAIHEIVSAYCSGGDVGVIDENGFLEPAPIEDFGGTTPSAGRAAARPVIATGAVELNTFEVTGHPANKFEEGTSAFALSSSSVDHPSAEHCPGASSLP